MKLCVGDYKTSSIELMDHFGSFPFKLSGFQKYAIEAIVGGKDVLITAHTGSGKTLAAEFAIRYFTNMGKKVIYTSPIKALSNQKFYEFQQKFPDISVGLLTGDIKMNPTASVLIMTTEILHKKLFNQGIINEFDLNFDDLVCVIFDEVHYINDKERGHIWEETIMNLPIRVQLTMLSATIDNPSKFAEWCEKRGNEVWLIPTYHRIVPLTHYAFVITNSQCLKMVDKDTQLAMKKFANKLHVIKDSSGIFVEKTYHEVDRFVNGQKGRITTRHVLNEVCGFMVDNEMLPALCFVLSRKRLEKCANSITTSLLEEDSDVPYIEKECDTILRKLPNYQEYLRLPEYHSLVALLKKGIAIHHAGVMPVLREMVEILYSRGYVKLLFATETFAVGVNMPTKTVLFTDVHKHDGQNVRVLYPHEYTQMAGRAGRRGIDTVGNVILLYNLFKHEKTSHREMLYGKPPKLESKFEITPSLLLSLIYNEKDVPEFINKTMCAYEAETQQTNINFRIQQLRDKLTVPLNPLLLEKYDKLVENIKIHKNRKRKEYQKDLAQLLDAYPTLEKNIPKMRETQLIQLEIEKLQEPILSFDKDVQDEMDVLIQRGFVDSKLTDLGVAAAQIHETHPLILSDVVMSGLLNTYTTKQLVGLFSCFTDVRLSEPRMQPLDDVLTKINDDIFWYSQDAIGKGKTFGLVLTYDLINYVMEWCDCESEDECKLVLQKMEAEGIFLGDVVKAILKIVNIAREVEKVAVMFNSPIMEAVSYVPNAMLKHMVNNDSLYI